MFLSTAPGGSEPNETIKSEFNFNDRKKLKYKREIKTKERGRKGGGASGHVVRLVRLLY